MDFFGPKSDLRFRNFRQDFHRCSKAWECRSDLPNEEEVLAVQPRKLSYVGQKDKYTSTLCQYIDTECQYLTGMVTFLLNNRTIKTVRWNEDTICWSKENVSLL